jgi:hypothetical protein
MEAGLTAIVPFFTKVNDWVLEPGVKPAVDTMGPDK